MLDDLSCREIEATRVPLASVPPPGSSQWFPRFGTTTRLRRERVTSIFQSIVVQEGGNHPREGGRLFHVLHFRLLNTISYWPADFSKYAWTGLDRS